MSAPPISSPPTKTCGIVGQPESADSSCRIAGSVPCDAMELGLFPLGIVLLPTERVPLHIFEPRYRERIGECIAEECEFGLVFADENGVRELGTRARVEEVLEQFDDGRMNIVV